MISIVTQYIALHYTKLFINEFCNNLFQDKIYFSSMSTNVVSLRLSREVYNFPVNLQLINSFHQKIIEGKVMINKKHQQALSNIMRTFYRQEDPTIVQMIQKNPYLVNSWFQQNATEISQLELLAQEILKNSSYLSPLLNSIGYYNQINQTIANYQRIPFKQILQSSSQDGILFSNFFNSSLSSVDDQNCHFGRFIYDPRCRFWYMTDVNQTSFFMNPPQISQGMTTPYLSQHGCQKMLFYNTTTNTIEIYKVQCIEAMLSNLYSYFENVIQSSKQYYIIDPRTLQILYNSRKQYNHSTLNWTDNFYNIEIQYSQDKVSSQNLLDVINSHFSKWTFLIQNNYTSILQMIDLSKNNIILDYNRNSSIYKVIINPVIGYDDIPKHISKYTNSQGQQLQYVYLQINLISDEELKAQTNQLIEFSSKLFLIIQILLDNKFNNLTSHLFNLRFKSHQLVKQNC
ncbi:tetratricopeptide repeat protein (macronuclear) [Tetrahymena thermophila SB210]|uniref:Tetratricopeptide repeat protein n=1 Tax=Tetrahymena thermophila (strain SB210) TaxID=312017 RepID=Q245P3_TETTS|nr:tetratricopeptide repeat protein [Tetrahymena thermophila SB210]EAS03590.2 tetratricopeptide repeat protein [Tetrahymena thermophila SB210]|eukprot:XP_001023835.2 tetratricopeptide repeat protein [Tetrahymena thermophila SB210]